VLENGEYCMSGGSDKLIRLWNPFANYTRPIQAYSGHSWDVVDLAMYPVDIQLLLTYLDHPIILDSRQLAATEPVFIGTWPLAVCFVAS
jgi:hypothetical protein